MRARLDLLLDDRAHPVQATVLVLAAVAVLVLPTVLVVLPWLTPGWRIEPRGRIAHDTDPGICPRIFWEVLKSP